MIQLKRIALPISLQARQRFSTLMRTRWEQSFEASVYEIQRTSQKTDQDFISECKKKLETKIQKEGFAFDETSEWCRVGVDLLIFFYYSPVSELSRHAKLALQKDAEHYTRLSLRQSVIELITIAINMDLNQTSNTPLTDTTINQWIGEFGLELPHLLVMILDMNLVTSPSIKPALEKIAGVCQHTNYPVKAPALGEFGHNELTYFRKRITQWGRAAESATLSRFFWQKITQDYTEAFDKKQEELIQRTIDRFKITVAEPLAPQIKSALFKSEIEALRQCTEEHQLLVNTKTAFHAPIIAVFGDPLSFQEETLEGFIDEGFKLVQSLPSKRGDVWRWTRYIIDHVTGQPNKSCLQALCRHAKAETPDWAQGWLNRLVVTMFLKKISERIRLNLFFSQLMDSKLSQLVQPVLIRFNTWSGGQPEALMNISDIWIKTLTYHLSELKNSKDLEDLISINTRLTGIHWIWAEGTKRGIFTGPLLTFEPTQSIHSTRHLVIRLVRSVQKFPDKDLVTWILKLAEETLLVSPIESPILSRYFQDPSQFQFWQAFWERLLFKPIFSPNINRVLALFYQYAGVKSELESFEWVVQNIMDHDDRIQIEQLIRKRGKSSTLDKPIGIFRSKALTIFQTVGYDQWIPRLRELRINQLIEEIRRLTKCDLDQPAPSIFPNILDAATYFNQWLNQLNDIDSGFLSQLISAVPRDEKEQKWLNAILGFRRFKSTVIELSHRRRGDQWMECLQYLVATQKKADPETFAILMAEFESSPDILALKLEKHSDLDRFARNLVIQDVLRNRISSPEIEADQLSKLKRLLGQKLKALSPAKYFIITQVLQKESQINPKECLEIVDRYQHITENGFILDGLGDSMWSDWSHLIGQYFGLILIQHRLPNLKFDNQLALVSRLQSAYGDPEMLLRQLAKLTPLHTSLEPDLRRFSTREWWVNDALVNRLKTIGDITELRTEMANCKGRYGSSSTDTDPTKNFVRRHVEARQRFVQTISQNDPEKVKELAVTTLMEKLATVQESVDECKTWTQDHYCLHNYEDANQAPLKTLGIIIAALHHWTRNSNTPFQKEIEVWESQRVAFIEFQSHITNKTHAMGEIGTGQGKSIIILLQVIYLALTKRRSIVVTSAKTLAARDSEKFYKFCKSYFNIEIGTCCEPDDTTSLDQEEKRLKTLFSSASVIYTDLGTIQKYYLLSLFTKTPLMPKFWTDSAYCIVDEVDNLAIDNSERVLYLSDTIPEFHHLHLLFVQIWQFVNSKQSIEVWQTLDPDRMAEEKEWIAQQISQLISSRKTPIPMAIQHFIRRRLPIYIESAIAALGISVNHQYAISGKGMGSKRAGGLVVVDTDTGIWQTQTEFNNGLHQFLQLKHGAPLTAENLKSTFVSNLKFFKLFGNRLFGLTGTLGSKPEQQFLNRLYGVLFFAVPRRKEHYFYEKPHIVKTDYLDWIDAILDTVRACLKIKQPVLLIMENIESAEVIYSHLGNADGLKELGINPRIYKSQFEPFSEEMGDTDVLVATNLAGRGTDIQLKNTHNPHGLRTILTSVVSNVRIERQGWGRSNRNTPNGCGQYIVCASEALSMGQLIAQRDLEESRRLHRMETETVNKLKVEDELMAKFADLRRVIGDMLRRSEDMKENSAKRSALRTYILKKFGLPDKMNEKLITIQLRFLGYHWALWLDQKTEEIESRTQALVTDVSSFFEEFENEMFKRFSCESFPFFWVQEFPEGLLQLGLEYYHQSQYKNAISAFETLQKLDPDYSYKGLIYLVLCRITCDPENDTVKQQCMAELRLAKGMIEKEIRRWEDHVLIRDIVTKTRALTSHKLDEAPPYQAMGKNMMALYQYHLQMIESAIGSHLPIRRFKTLDHFLVLGNLGGEWKPATMNTADIWNQLIEKSFLKPAQLSKKVEVQINDLPRIWRNEGGEPVHIFIPRKRFLLDLNGLLALIKTRLDQDNRGICPDDLIPFLVSRDPAITVLLEAGIISKSDDSFSAIKKVELADLQAIPIFKSVHPDCLAHVVTWLDRTPIEKSAFPVTDSQPENAAESLFTYLVSARVIKQERANYSIKARAINTDTAFQTFSKLLTRWFVDGRALPFKPIQVELKALLNAEVEVHLKTQREKWVEFNLNQGWDEATLKKENKGMETGMKLAHERYGNWVNEVVKVVTDVAGILKTTQNTESALKPLTDMLDLKDIPPELEVFKALYFDQLLVLQQYKSRFDPRALAVAVFGLLQIGLGILINAVSFGGLSHIGSMFIGEGLGDIIFATMTGLNKDFSWEAYRRHKAISMAITLACGAIGTIMKLSQGIQTFLEMTDEAYSVLRASSRWSVTRQAVGIASRQAGKQILTQLTHTSVMIGIDYALSEFTQTFSRKVATWINERIEANVKSENNFSQLKKEVKTAYETISKLVQIRGNLQSNFDSFKQQMNAELKLFEQTTFSQDYVDIASKFIGTIKYHVASSTAISGGGKDLAIGLLSGIQTGLHASVIMVEIQNIADLAKKASNHFTQSWHRLNENLEKGELSLNAHEQSQLQPLDEQILNESERVSQQVVDELKKWILNRMTYLIQSTELKRQIRQVICRAATRKVHQCLNRLNPVPPKPDVEPTEDETDTQDMPTDGSRRLPRVFSRPKGSRFRRFFNPPSRTVETPLTAFGASAISLTQLTSNHFTSRIKKKNRELQHQVEMENKVKCLLNELEKVVPPAPEENPFSDWVKKQMDLVQGRIKQVKSDLDKLGKAEDLAEKQATISATEFSVATIREWTETLDDTTRKARVLMWLSSRDSSYSEPVDLSPIQIKVLGAWYIKADF